MEMIIVIHLAVSFIRDFNRAGATKQDWLNLANAYNEIRRRMKNGS